MPERLVDIRAEPQLQPALRMASGHRLQDTARLQPQDLQQPGIRGPAVAVGVAGLRGGVPAHAHVYYTHELRQGLGGRVQTSNSDIDAVLDRAAPERSAAVARPRPHSDGLASAALLLHVLDPPQSKEKEVILTHNVQS